MQLTLNGSSVTIGFDKKGAVKSASQALGDKAADGYAVVTFLTPAVAQEICVSSAQGFSSVRTYKNNQLLREVCSDMWHKKAFYYTYQNGAVIETQIRSLGAPDKDQKTKRSSITHCSTTLFQDLAAERTLIFTAKGRWKPTPSLAPCQRAFSRSRAA